MLYRKIRVTVVYNFILKKYHFRGWWSATPKNGGAVNENSRDHPEKWVAVSPYSTKNNVRVDYPTQGRNAQTR